MGKRRKRDPFEEFLRLLTPHEQQVIQYRRHRIGTLLAAAQTEPWAPSRRPGDSRLLHIWGPPPPATGWMPPPPPPEPDPLPRVRRTIKPKPRVSGEHPKRKPTPTRKAPEPTRREIADAIGREMRARAFGRHA